MYKLLSLRARVYLSHH
uniref:Uncharacterized protein n=1 Tax=Anguilla anguilla TaxID=7936 RepID=A0A0E9RI07_ANGAN